MLYYLQARKAETSVKKSEKKDINIKTQTKQTAENVKVNLEADTGVRTHSVAADSSVITVPKQKNIRWVWISTVMFTEQHHLNNCHFLSTYTLTSGYFFIYIFYIFFIKNVH